LLPECGTSGTRNYLGMAEGASPNMLCYMLAFHQSLTFW